MTKSTTPSMLLILCEGAPMLLITYWNQHTKSNWEQMAVISLTFTGFNLLWSLFKIVKTIKNMDESKIKKQLTNP